MAGKEYEYMCELLKAFKNLGGNENGFIAYDKIAPLLKVKLKISEQEVSKLLYADEICENGQLDFVKLVSKITYTKKVHDRLQKANQCAAQSSRKINYRTYTKRKGSAQSATRGKPSQENAKTTQEHKSSLKGCIFDTESSVELSGHRYCLELTSNTPVEIVARSIAFDGQLSPVPVIDVLLFLENDEPNKKLVTFSSHINSEGYCCIKMNLKKGKYLLVPVALNWHSGGNESYVEAAPLIDSNSDGEVLLTSACKAALKAVFDIIDLDCNDLLNQEEFDIFIQHISGETSLDEWSTVLDNFDTVNGQLTFDGFMALYTMAIATDSPDVIQMFRRMGLSNSFKMEEALPFMLTVGAKACEPVLQPIPISIFDSLMEEVFRKTAIEQGYCNKIQNMNDLFLYIHKLPHRVTLVIKNQSHCKMKIRLDCNKSTNCISSQGALIYTVEVQPRTSLVGHHLFPKQWGEPWSVHCIENVTD